MCTAIFVCIWKIQIIDIDIVNLHTFLILGNITCFGTMNLYEKDKHTIGPFVSIRKADNIQLDWTA